MVLAYEEIIDFIAAGTTPEAVVSFRPSARTLALVSDLVRRQKSSELTQDELEQLHGYMQLEHIMRLAKARAHQRLQSD